LRESYGIFKPLKLTAFRDWFQFFEGGSGSSKQKIGKYFAKETSRNLLTRNSTDWGSSKQENVVMLVRVF
jgi:hypothetical protein